MKDPMNTGGTANSCSLVRELLPEAVGGDLDKATELAIARHVSSCHGCGREWASLRRAHRALTSLSDRNLVDGEGCEVDDAFFAELHQDILGEVLHRDQIAKDQRVFEKSRPVAGISGIAGSGMARSGIVGLWERIPGSLKHVASLAAAVLLGVLIGKQFDAAGTPHPDRPDGNGAGSHGAIMVRGDRLGGGDRPDGGMRGAGQATPGPRVKRIDERDMDREFRAWLDRFFKDSYLPQPVVPDSDISVLPVTDDGSEREARKGARKKADSGR